MNAPKTLWSWTLAPNAGNRADSRRAHARSSAIRHVTLQGAGVDDCVPASTIAQLQAFATQHGIGDAIAFVESTADRADSVLTALARLTSDMRVRVILMTRQQAAQLEGLASVQKALRASGRILLMVDAEGTELLPSGPPAAAVGPRAPSPSVESTFGADDRQVT